MSYVQLPEGGFPAGLHWICGPGPPESSKCRSHMASKSFTFIIIDS